MSGPSLDAKRKAWAAYKAKLDDERRSIFVAVVSGVEAAHDPTLGENASVRLGDVLDFIRRFDAEEGVFPGPTVVEQAHREGRI